MASILKFSSEGVTRERAMPVSAGKGELVAMQHIDLETVVETVRVLRALERNSLLDEFNGRRHAAKVLTR